MQQGICIAFILTKNWWIEALTCQLPESFRSSPQLPIEVNDVLVFPTWISSEIPQKTSTIMLIYYARENVGVHHVNSIGN